MEAKLYNETVDFLKQIFKDDADGHDLDHTLRVYRTSMKIAESEYCNEFLIGISALLHDVDDYKLSPDTARNHLNANTFMKKQGIPESQRDAVIHIIEQVSFSNMKPGAPDSIEAQIVQDADRLDAIGAIGIARVFAYGGAHGRRMHDPDILPQMNMSKEEYRAHISTDVNHFYEKLFLLKERMNTDTAKQIAEQRQKVMQEWLNEFLLEWNGQR